MKAFIKIIFSLLVISAVSSSCSVEYRTRHPRHRRVVVVGKAGGEEKIKTTETNAAAKDANSAAVEVH